MADNLINIFEKKNELIASNPVYHPYRGYTLWEPEYRGTRIRFEASDLPDNYMIILSYSCLESVQIGSNSILTLMFSNNTVITVRGSNLDQLVDPLQEELVKSLEVFMPRWNLPPERDSVFISAIDVHSDQEWNEHRDNIKKELAALTNSTAPQE
jgi:hypothetical protein